jgi:glycosyltransferase involved in cell wall biosynthesis
MKILFLSTGLTTGGAEVMLYNLLSKIDRQKYQPSVISLMDEGRFGQAIKQLNIPVYGAGMNPGKPTIKAIATTINLVKKVQPDLIQGWMYHGNLAAQAASFLNGQNTPVLWSIHHSLYSLKSEKITTQAIIRLGSLTSKAVAQIAYVSQKSQIEHQKIGYSKENSCVIPNGFDTSLLQPSTQIREQFRKSLNLPPESILIGSIARYHPMKDHANFLDAAKLLLADFPTANFVLVGPQVDNNNPALTQQIKSLGIGDRVHLLGERTDIPQITPALDILTSSSAFGEAFPLVIGEAMSCGVPCVATDVGDCAWIVGDTGQIVPPQNAAALARGWHNILSLDSAQKQALGIAARQRIIEFFSLDFVVSQYEKLYDSVFY